MPKAERREFEAVEISLHASRRAAEIGATVVIGVGLKGNELRIHSGPIVECDWEVF